MKNNTAEYLFKIVMDSHKTSIEQYKITATLLITANGGAVLCLINKNIELYLNSIFMFSLSILISFIMLFLAFIRSCVLTEKLGDVKKFSSIQESISAYTATTRFMYICIILSFGVSLIGFEYELIKALETHNFDIYKLFN